MSCREIYKVSSKIKRERCKRDCKSGWDCCCLEIKICFSDLNCWLGASVILGFISFVFGSMLMITSKHNTPSWIAGIILLSITGAITITWIIIFIIYCAKSKVEENRKIYEKSVVPEPINDFEIPLQIEEIPLQIEEISEINSSSEILVGPS